MKTAGEWVKVINNDEIKGCPDNEAAMQCCIINAYEIEQILLDGIKEGMTRATLLPSKDALAAIHVDLFIESILLARDNLTSL